MSGITSQLLDRAPIAALKSRYAEPWRHYHVWAHPRAMLGHLAAADAAGVTIVDHDAAIGFILWHDAIYDPESGGGRNERLSAALCRAEMAPLVNATSVERAVRAIEATAAHVMPEGECPDAALLLDIDLSILGANPRAFDEYDVAIRREYAHVTEEVYRPARQGILARFLDRDRLYLTEWAFAQWEERARGNLERAIAALA